MLLDKKKPIKAVADELGYCDTYAFCKQFKKHAGISPGQFVSNFQNNKLTDI
ncbi:MAG: helix-turn-helix transcriptional regulator [Ruminococcaceae bacterium]|nr:helix-turn-helix transcriptional regulator [Oscillospiraceae bacterium]